MKECWQVSERPAVPIIIWLLNVTKLEVKCNKNNHQSHSSKVFVSTSSISFWRCLLQMIGLWRRRFCAAISAFIFWSCCRRWRWRQLGGITLPQSGNHVVASVGHATHRSTSDVKRLWDKGLKLRLIFGAGTVQGCWGRPILVHYVAIRQLVHNAGLQLILKSFKNWSTRSALTVTAL